MTNFEWLKNRSVDELVIVLTEFGLYYEEHVNDKELFAGPGGWQMTRDEAERDWKEWLEKEYEGDLCLEALNDK